MAESPHEVLHGIFKRDTTLVTRTLDRVLQIKLPDDATAEVVDADCTRLDPIERRADTVILIKSSEYNCVLIVESQTKIDPRKEESWPLYMSSLRNQHKCEVGLLVLTSDRATARWAARPIEHRLLGRPFMIIYPAVIGPDTMPVITDPAQAAEDPMFALLAALTHGRDRDPTAILEALATALATIDPEEARSIAELTFDGLPTHDAYQIWRTLMSAQTHEYQHEYAQELLSQGEAKGEARGEARGEGRILFMILEQRGIDVPDWARERITSCTETETLEHWAGRAFAVTTIEDLFAD